MLLLISGHNRSGTTLAQRLCDSHPAIGMTNEFGGLAYINEGLEAYRRHILHIWWKKQNSPFFRGERLWGRWCYDPVYMEKRTRSLACLASKLTRIHMLQNLYFVARYLYKLPRDRGAIVDAQAIDVALRAVFPGAHIIGDNHPDYMYQLDRLVAVDGLSTLIVYRDPRDVVSDCLKRLRPRWWKNEARIDRDLRPWWPGKLQTAEGLAERWVQTTHTMARHRDRIHVIRYEHLVTDPQTVLTRLGDWLGVDSRGFGYRMIRPGGNIGVYHDGLSDQELADVLRVAGPTMQQLGYEI